MRYYSSIPEYSEITLEEKSIRDKIIVLFGRHTQNLESEPYYGKHLGIPVDDYEEVADEIIMTFNVKELTK